MSSRLNNNLQSFFDDHHKVHNNFDNHVASPSVQYNSCSLPKHLQYQQSQKMPGLLRLDSVGEVSSVRLPADRNTKPVLRNCKSNDCDTASASKRNIFSTHSNMATVKSFAGTHQYSARQMSAPVDTKAHSISQMSHHSSTPWLGGMSLSSDYQYKGFISDNMLSLLKPKINDCNKMFATVSHYKSPDAIWTAVDACICSEDEKGNVPKGTCCSPLSILSKFAATYTTPKSSSDFSMSTSSMQFQEKSNNPDINGTCNLPVKDVKLSDVNVEKTVEVCTVFDKNLVEEEKLLADEFSSNESLLCLPLISCQHKEADSIINDASKSSSVDRKCTSVETSHCSLKSGIDLLSVLSAPRKTTKKGRPSSKKQKKRQREKHKQENLPLGIKEIVDVTDKTWKNQANSTCRQLEKRKSSHTQIKKSLKPGLSSAKVQSKCPIVSLFVGRMPVFEEIDDNNNSDEDSDNCEENEWSLSNDKMTCIPSLNCPSLNVALNLDSIFKKKSIPSLKSIFSAEESDSDSETSSVLPGTKEFNCPTVDTSKEDSFEDTSVELCFPLTSIELKSLGFTTGLSEDSLFSKKPSFYSKKVVVESTVDVVDDLSSDNSHPISSNLQSCLEAINKINAKWDLEYPTAGFRSCHSVSADEIIDSSIKVHFAAEPNLLTVHIVGTEERGGSWHQFSLDRERFHRRILDLEEIISPILEANHRAKILDRNQCSRSALT